MENTVTMLRSVTGGQMNSFVITTEDGKVIVMDGGFRRDAQELLRYLRELTGEQVPHVDGWILTHPHLDHIDCFLEIMENMPDALEVDTIYYHFPSVRFVRIEEDGETVAQFYRLLPTFAERCCIVSGSDVIDIGAARFECLYSHDSEFTHNVVNNSSLVLMMTLGGKKVLFTGDCGSEAGNKILRMYGDRLRADYVQMAHHGQNGVDREFYEAVRPVGCLWCTPKWLWNNDVGKGFNTHIFKTVTVRGWMEELGVGEHYILMNGTQTLTL